MAGAAIGAVATLGSAWLSSNAARSAAESQANATRDANAVQYNIYNQQRADQAPWRNAGGAAVGYLGYLLGLPGYNNLGGQPVATNAYAQLPGTTPRGTTLGSAVGAGGIRHSVAGSSAGLPVYRDGLLMRDTQNLNYEPDVLSSSGVGAGVPASSGVGPGVAPAGPAGDFGSLLRAFSMGDFQADPGYAFRLAEGQKALERSAAARGGLLSGGAGKALERYGQEMGSQEYMNAFNRYQTNQSNVFNRLAAMAGYGQTANNALASAGQNYANNVGGALLNLGQGQAGAHIANANAWSGALNNLGNLWMQYSGGQNQGGGGMRYGNDYWVDSNGEPHFA